MMLNLQNHLVIFRFYGILFVISLLERCIFISCLSLEDKDKIDEAIENTMTCSNIPGITMLVTNKEGVIYKKGYGVADVAGTPITPDTLFPIASTTKAFTTTLLAILVRKHRLSWDSKIKDIYKDFRLYNDDLTNQVTIRDILSHRTGIPDYFLLFLAGYPDTLSDEDFIRGYMYHKPIAPLRTQFLYNNHMYALAGFLAEKLEHDTWQNLVEKYIFRPLNMTSTTVIGEMPLPLNIAHPFALWNNSLIQLDVSTLKQVNKADAAGAILSSANDMGKWMQFHLSKGLLPTGERLLKEEEINEMYKPSMAIDYIFPPPLIQPSFPVSDVHIGYGLGWINSNYRGYLRIWHSGSISTYQAQVWLFPDLDLGIYLEDNGPTSAKWAMVTIAHYISDILHGNSMWLNGTDLCSFPSEYFPSRSEPQELEQPLKTTPEANTGYPHPLSVYTGTYLHHAFGTVQVTEKAGKLFLELGQFIKGNVVYDSTENEFLLTLTDSYWYMDMTLPIEFHSPEYINQNDMHMSVIGFPLYYPFRNAQSSFVREKLSNSALKASVDWTLSSTYVFLMLCLCKIIIDLN